jgi:hypothetical protein
VKVGDTFMIPAGEGEHSGHTATVTKVRQDPPDFGPNLNQGGPDQVTVECSCGDSWSFTDFEEERP